VLRPALAGPRALAGEAEPAAGPLRAGTGDAVPGRHGGTSLDISPAASRQTFNMFSSRAVLAANLGVGRKKGEAGKAPWSLALCRAGS